MGGRLKHCHINIGDEVIVIGCDWNDETPQIVCGIVYGGIYSPSITICESIDNIGHPRCMTDGFCPSELKPTGRNFRKSND